MNYLQMFAKGGKTKGTDIIKGIQKILGVDDNQMAELWQVGINKYGSEEGIAQALNEATKDLTPQSSPDEVKAAVATVFSTGSEMFKCGGKLQKLAKRFAKGSSIDCGCNGTKLKQNGGLLNNRFYNLPDRVYNEKGVFSGYINGPEDVAYIQSRKEPRDWTVQSPTPQARLNNTTNQSRMLWNPEKLPEPYYTAYVITENPEGKGNVAHIPMNQDGGEVTEAANGVRLTRRQARDLSKQNKGYSNSQYATAYANAVDALRRNSDLRGRDLRNQARIMASGISVGDNSQSIVDSSTPEITVAVAPAGQLNEVKTREQALNDLVSSVIRGNYGNGAQRRKALDSYYDEVQSEVAKRIRNTEKPVIDTKSKTSQQPAVYSSIERYTRYNDGPAFGRRSFTKVPVSTSNEQVVGSDTASDVIVVPRPVDNTSSSTISRQSQNERNRRMGRVEAYQRMTGADEALAEWGQQPYQNVDRNSEEYKQGQSDAQREAAITTGAGVVAAAAVPAAINAAATYIPQGVQYLRLANDLNRTRRAAQAARGTGQMLMRNAGSSAARYTPNEIFRMLEASRLTPLPGSLQKGGIVNSDGYRKRPSFSKRLNLDATINSKQGDFGGIAYDETYPESTIIRRIYEYPNGEADTLLIKRGMTFASPYGNAVVDSNYIEPSKTTWKKANNKFELAKDAALLQQKGGIVKGQTRINSENIDSAPEQVMRIPKYGTIRLLRSRNFAGSEQPDSTFTFTPISKSAYYIPAGTYSRFTNYDGNVETRGYDVDGLNNFTYGETAHRQFNGIRSLWEANKDKRKIVIPKNTGTY